jgi:hypothetical protein
MEIRRPSDFQRKRSGTVTRLRVASEEPSEGRAAVKIHLDSDGPEIHAET